MGKELRCSHPTVQKKNCRDMLDNGALLLGLVSASANEFFVVPISFSAIKF